MGSSVLISFISVTGTSIEDALQVGPRHEWALFTNREKFDLVAMYDNSSENFGSGNSPLSALVRAIYETAFRKILKRMPVLLVGGFAIVADRPGTGSLTASSAPTK